MTNVTNLRIFGFHKISFEVLLGRPHKCGHFFNSMLFCLLDQNVVLASIPLHIKALILVKSLKRTKIYAPCLFLNREQKIRKVLAASHQNNFIIQQDFLFHRSTLQVQYFFFPAGKAQDIFFSYLPHSRQQYKTEP